MALFVTNTPNIARYAGLFAGTLVFLYITFEAPLSGMSINPARTVASGVPSRVWTGRLDLLRCPADRSVARGPGLSRGQPPDSSRLPEASPRHEAALHLLRPSRSTSKKKG